MDRNFTNQTISYHSVHHSNSSTDDVLRESQTFGRAAYPQIATTQLPLMASIPYVLKQSSSFEFGAISALSVYGLTDCVQNSILDPTWLLLSFLAPLVLQRRTTILEQPFDQKLQSVSVQLRVTQLNHVHNNFHVQLHDHHVSC